MISTSSARLRWVERPADRASRRLRAGRPASATPAAAPCRRIAPAPPAPSPPPREIPAAADAAAAVASARPAPRRSPSRARRELGTVRAAEHPPIGRDRSPRALARVLRPWLGTDPGRRRARAQAQPVRARSSPAKRAPPLLSSHRTSARSIAWSPSSTARRRIGKDMPSPCPDRRPSSPGREANSPVHAPSLGAPPLTV